MGDVYSVVYIRLFLLFLASYTCMRTHAHTQGTQKLTHTCITVRPIVASVCMNRHLLRLKRHDFRGTQVTNIVRSPIKPLL